MGQVGEGKREPEVTAQMNMLEEAIGRLADAAVGLSKRLEPVTRPDLKELTPETSAPEPNLCLLANTLRSLQHRVNNIRKGIESQVSRLEL